MPLIVCYCRELLTYTDSSKPLAETDLDKIGKTKPIDNVKPVNAPNGENEEKLNCIGQSENSDDDAKLEADNNETPSEEAGLLQDKESICNSNSQDSQIALKFSFTLPSSCYATMAIRELLKTSTSVSTQFEYLIYVDMTINGEVIIGVNL